MSEQPPDDLGNELVARACRILERSGDEHASRLLGRLRVAVEPGAHWSLSGRSVDAHRVVLLAPGDLILQLRADSALRERLRLALAAAFDTPSRMLHDLVVVLDDASMLLSDSDWLRSSHPYRDGPITAPLAHPSVLIRAAQVYANAAGDADAAELLSRARLSVQPCANAPADRPQTLRVSLLLGLSDLARTAGDGALRDGMISALRAVTQAPHRVVAEIGFAPDWQVALQDEIGPVAQPARRTMEVLRDLLAADGVASAVVETRALGVRLVVSLGGRVGILDLGEGPSSKSTLSVVHVRVDQDGSDLAQVARSIRSALLQSPQ